MSWHYSLELAEESLEQDSGPCAASSPMNFAEQGSSRDKMKAILTDSQSGMMLRHSTGDRGVDAFILSLEDSRANPGQVQANKKENLIHEIFGLTQLGSFAKWNPDSYSWRTHQDCEIFHISEEFSETWPVAGSISDGLAFRRNHWEPITVAPACGYLPTPVSSDWHNRQASKNWQGNDLVSRIGGIPNPNFVEWMMGIPRGWSASAFLETHRFQEWHDLHSRFLGED